MYARVPSARFSRFVSAADWEQTECAYNFAVSSDGDAWYNSASGPTPPDAPPLKKARQIHLGAEGCTAVQPSAPRRMSTVASTLGK